MKRTQNGTLLRKRNKPHFFSLVRINCLKAMHRQNKIKNKKNNLRQCIRRKEGQCPIVPPVLESRVIPKR